MFGEGIVGAGVTVHGANDGDVVGQELGLRATEHQQHQQRHEHGSRGHHRHRAAARHCGHGLGELGIIEEWGQPAMEARLETEGERRRRGDEAEANKRM